jgi:hypothetical protein
MKIAGTSTTTTTTIAAPVEQTEIRTMNQPEGKQEPGVQNRVSESETKSSQSLAEQNKASQKLQAEMQKSQLQGQFSGMPSTKTTTTSTAGAAKTSITAESGSAASLDELTARHRLDPKQIAELKEFAKKSGVPERDLLKVASNERYSGAEKTEAMKAYAIAYDAAQNGKLSAGRAQGLKEHVLPNLLEGKIGIRLRDMGDSRAQYNGRNEGNTSKYEANTMYLPKEGLNLQSREDRGVLVHESQHAVQDSSRKELTFLQSEKDGHAAYADYILRDSGAIKDTPNGPQLDYNKFSEVLARNNDVGDKKSLLQQFSDAADVNWKNGKGELNGILNELGRDAAGHVRNLDSELSFEEAYIKQKANQSFEPKKTEAQIASELNQSAPKDGI